MSEFPISGFYFDVRIGGSGSIQFKEVSGLKADIKYKDEPREGGNAVVQHKVFEKIEHGPVTLKKGLVKNKGLAIKLLKDKFNIHLDHSTSGSVLRPQLVTITLKNEKGSPIMVFALDGAYPTSWEISAFDAMSHEVTLETLQIEYKSLKIA